MHELILPMLRWMKSGEHFDERVLITGKQIRYMQATMKRQVGMNYVRMQFLRKYFNDEFDLY